MQKESTIRYEVSPWKGEPFKVHHTVRHEEKSICEDWYVLPVTWQPGDPLPEERKVCSYVVGIIYEQRETWEHTPYIRRDASANVIRYVGDIAFPYSGQNDLNFTTCSMLNGLRNYLSYLMIGERNPENRYGFFGKEF